MFLIRLICDFQDVVSNALKVLLGSEYINAISISKSEGNKGLIPGGVILSDACKNGEVLQAESSLFWCVPSEL